MAYCQSGTCQKHAICPFPLPSQSSSFSFPIYLSLQDDLSEALTAFQMAKMLQLSKEILFLVELNVS